MSDPSPPTTYGVGQYVASEAHMAMLPRNWTGGGTKRCALVLPGWNGNARTLTSPFVNYLTAQKLARRGLPSFCGDYGNGRTWGNDTIQSRLSSMWTFAQSSFGAKTDKLLLWGGSMGTFGALNWARNNPTKVAAIAITLPAVDLSDAYTNKFTAITNYLAPVLTTLGEADSQVDINAAYGGSAGYTSALPTHNPNTTANKSSLASASIPIRFWYAADDPLADPILAQSFAASVGATAISMGNTGGHQLSTSLIVDPTPITDWLMNFV